MNYQEMTDDALMAQMRQAGRTPDQELIQAWMDRYERLRPNLLRLLSEAGEMIDEDDDDDGFTVVHAGRLLLVHRDAEALPLFMEILTLDRDENPLVEWFETDLHHYGPVVMAPLLEILNDADLDGYTRGAVIEIIVDLALRFPETRTTVRTALRSLLPTLNDDGQVSVGEGDAEEEEISLWTFTVDGLGTLGDKQIIPLVKAMHEQDLIDEIVYGDFDEFMRYSFSAKGHRREKRKGPFNIFHAYGYR